MKTFPLSTSSFEDIITSNAVYIDKTESIYHLIKDKIPKRYFFARPRRFGKSLTCSTLEAIFSGKKELFKDLWIYHSDYAWTIRPVIYFDFNEIGHETLDILVQSLNESVDKHAQKYGIQLTSTQLKGRLAELIYKLGQTVGPVAVIIDEYDKPIINSIDNPEQAKLIGKELDCFFGTFKAHDVDSNLQFLFITGIHTFSKEVIFNSLNNLFDITHYTDSATLVGYTNQEIDRYLTEHIQSLADTRNEPYEQTRNALKQWYDGYNFLEDCITTLYNPFVVNHCLAHKKIGNYWFISGPTTFLKTLIDHNGQSIINEIKAFETIYAESYLYSYSIDNYYTMYRTFLLQEGYATFIKPYNEDIRCFTLGYPNEEIRSSIEQCIIEYNKTAH